MEYDIRRQMVGVCIQIVVALRIDDIIIIGVGTFLYDIVVEHTGMIAKDIVAGKLRLTDGNESPTVFHVMHAVNGETPCLDKGRTKWGLWSHRNTMTYETVSHDIGLQRKMATQTAVAATDDNQAIAIILVYRDNSLHSFARHSLGLLARHSPCIGEDIEEGLLILEPQAYAILVPLCDQQAAMYRLYARWVVIEND